MEKVNIFGLTKAQLEASLGTDFTNGLTSEEALTREKAEKREPWPTNVVVIRDGKERQIDASELVCGEVIRLCTGELFRVDLIILEAEKLQVEEDIVTQKLPVPEEGAGGGPKDCPYFVRSLSPVVNGSGVGVVVAVRDCVGHQVAAAANEAKEEMRRVRKERAKECGISTFGSIKLMKYLMQDQVLVRDELALGDLFFLRTLVFPLNIECEITVCGMKCEESTTEEDLRIAAMAGVTTRNDRYDHPVEIACVKHFGKPSDVVAVQSSTMVEDGFASTAKRKGKLCFFRRFRDAQGLMCYRYVLDDNDSRTLQDLCTDVSRDEMEYVGCLVMDVAPRESLIEAFRLCGDIGIRLVGYMAEKGTPQLLKSLSLDESVLCVEREVEDNISKVNVVEECADPSRLVSLLKANRESEKELVGAMICHSVDSKISADSLFSYGVTGTDVAKEASSLILLRDQIRDVLFAARTVHAQAEGKKCDVM